MKTISLKELNTNGQLINEFKKVAFTRKGYQRPLLFPKNNPTTCYIHFYKNMYYVTKHINKTRQNTYTDYKDAIIDFTNSIECTSR